jgi:integrase
VRWTLGGRGARRRYGGSFPRKADANVRAAWIRGELAALRVPDLLLVEPEPALVKTLTEDAERWQASRVDVAEGTAKTYAVNLGRILPLLGPKPTGEITTEDVQAFVNELHADGEGLDRESIRKTKSTLAQVLDFAGVQPNPARDPKVKLPRKEPEEPNPPTAEHVEATLRLLPSLYHLPALWLDHSGARVGSVDTLTIGDYDQTRNRIRARAATTKNRRAIWIDLPPALAEAIEGALPPRYERDLAAPPCSRASSRPPCERRSGERAGRRASLSGRPTTCGAGESRSCTCGEYRGRESASSSVSGR